MDLLVAAVTQRDQVRLGVISQKTSRPNVMDLEMFGRPTLLAPPTIALKHLLAKSAVRLGSEPEPRSPHDGPVHEAFPIASKNCCCWDFEIKAKMRPSANGRVSVRPLSKLAPARKSAQIISRQ